MRVAHHRKEWALAIVGGRRYAALTLGPHTLSAGQGDPASVYGLGIAVMKWEGVFTLSVYVSPSLWWDVATWGSGSGE